MSADKEILLLSMLRKQRFYRQYSQFIKVEYFSSEYTAAVFQYISKYMEKYPEKDMASKRNLRMMIEEGGDDGRLIREVISNLENPKYIDEDLFGEKIAAFIKEGIVRQMLMDHLPLLEGRGKADIDSMLAELTKAKDTDIMSSTLYDYVAETEQLHRSFSPQGDQVPTPVFGLDTVLHYPPSKGEEWIIMGPPGRGKTLWMLNCTAHAAKAGWNCLYITAGDQGRMRLQTRLDSLVSGIPYSRFFDPGDRVLGLLRKRVLQEVKGKIFIQDWSSTSCTPTQVETLIQSFAGSLDVVAVDYPDIMRPNTYYSERRHEIASIYSLLRNMAVKYDFLLWAGSQANRSSLDKQIITMKDVAEDIQKCWVADGILTFCQTEEEREEGMGRFYIPKARRPPMREFEVKFEIDDKTGRIT